ncbi:hypothetical protein GCM10009422_14490 [Brevundimonas kwangchunensis]|uniref:Lysozyme n=1 Tax=Brevundimonas kwangchunensis TaxID=322163 RepID=A0ABN1GUK8_9CAUL
MSDTSRPRLKVSREGIVLIKSFEGFRPHAVRDDAEGWVIGYGHKVSAREGAYVGEADAELLLHYDLMPVVQALNAQVSTPLNQHQFDALASFAISIGLEAFLQSDVLGRLNSGRTGEAADALIEWPERLDAGARLRRRAAERALFVADPSGPVTLADLMAAPLPPPVPMTTAAVETADVIRPDFSQIAAAPRDDKGQADEATDSATAAEDSGPSAPSHNGAAPVTTGTRHQHLRYAAYAAPVFGPLPGLPFVQPAQATTSEAEEASTAGSDTSPTAFVAPDEDSQTSETEAVDYEAIQNNAPAETPSDTSERPEPAPSPELAPFPQAAAPSPFPPLGDLVLTPAVESDFPVDARPVWLPEQRSETTPTDPLFDDEPSLSVLRHEIEPERARRFDWSETGAFLIMGGVGLAACAASAAAFRLSVTEPSDMGETTVIAWALALIGAICVGVSSWNLYVRWGRQD